MLLYVDELLSEIDSIAEYAEIISEKFDQGRDCKELLLDARALQKRLEYYVSVMPEALSSARKETRFFKILPAR